MPRFVSCSFFRNINCVIKLIYVYIFRTKYFISVNMQRKMMEANNIYVTKCEFKLAIEGINIDM